MYRLDLRPNVYFFNPFSECGSREEVGGMNKSGPAQCARAVSLFRGLYARVARELRVDVSYISRIARGERKSIVAHKALNREFNKVLAAIKNSSARPDRNRRRQTRRQVHHNR
jgi:hypothetical protein